MEYYKHKIICIECKKLFIGGYKRKRCNDCKKKNFYFVKKIAQEVRCLRCNKLFKIQYKRKTSWARKVVYKICKGCRKKTHNIIYKIFKRKIVCKWCKKTIKTEKVKIRHNTKLKTLYKYHKKCSSTFISSRMKINNPMFNIKIRKKVAKTLKEKYIKNTFISPTWKKKKFKRKQIYRTCRHILYFHFVRPILERDKYKCSKCGTKNNLQVHHLKPFRKIIKTVLKKFFNYNSIDELKNQIEIKFFIKNIIDYHKVKYGITVCKECHEKVDYQYRTIRGKRKDKNVCKKNLKRILQRRRI